MLCNAPILELPGRPSSLTVSDINARSVWIQFIPGFDGHSFIKRWIVEAKVGSSSIFTTVFNVTKPKATSLLVEGLRPYTKYQLRLIAENVRGRGGPSDPTRVFQTLQTFPESAPEKIYAEPISSDQISLSWTHIAYSNWNGDPVGYLILFKEIIDEDSAKSLQETWVNFCCKNFFNKTIFLKKEHIVSNFKTNEIALSHLSPYKSYQLKICAKNAFGNSNFSDVVTATTYESG